MLKFFINDDKIFYAIPSWISSLALCVVALLFALLYLNMHSENSTAIKYIMLGGTAGSSLLLIASLIYSTKNPFKGSLVWGCDKQGVFATPIIAKSASHYQWNRIERIVLTNILMHDSAEKTFSDQREDVVIKNTYLGNLSRKTKKKSTFSQNVIIVYIDKVNPAKGKFANWVEQCSSQEAIGLAFNYNEEDISTIEETLKEFSNAQVKLIQMESLEL